MKSQIKAGILWVILVLADQLVKLWVLATLKGKEPIVLLKNVLEFRYVENRGAAFGIFQNRQWFFIVVTLVVLAAIFYFSRRIPKTKHFLWLNLCMYFMSAGAVGNLIDRVLRNYVVDFIYFKLIDFPVFNVADIYVTCSAILLALLILFYYKEEELEQILGREEKDKK